MTFLQKFLFSGGVALATLVLPSCNGFGGGADLVNPTQSELDAADVSWGLKARQARGGPRRTVMYEDGGSGSTGSGTVTTPAPVDAAPVQAPNPTPAPPPIPDPAIDINKLR